MSPQGCQLSPSFSPAPVWNAAAAAAEAPYKTRRGTRGDGEGLLVVKGTFGEVVGCETINNNSLGSQLNHNSSHKAGHYVLPLTFNT